MEQKFGLIESHVKDIVVSVPELHWVVVTCRHVHGFVELDAVTFQIVV